MPGNNSVLQGVSPHRCCLLQVVPLFLLVFLPQVFALNGQINVEYRVKAVFLLKLAKFVEWPDHSFSPDGAFAIGVLGIDPFGGELEKICEVEMIGGRKLVLRKGKKIEELGHCHMIFFSRSEEKRFAHILENLRQKSVLTVADSDTFIRSGGMINFIPKGNRIGFEINPNVARDAGLQVSSLLLKLGIIKD